MGKAAKRYYPARNLTFGELRRLTLPWPYHDGKVVIYKDQSQVKLHKSETAANAHPRYKNRTRLLSSEAHPTLGSQNHARAITLAAGYLQC